jgi:hypothetical protein
MYVYADPKNKTCEILYVDCILDAISFVRNTKGVLYLTDDTEEENNNNYTNEECQEKMLESLVWKDGQLSLLGYSILGKNNKD